MMGKHQGELNFIFTDVSMVVTKYLKVIGVKKKPNRNWEWHTLRNK
jgi:hypothetical protein